MEKQTEIGAIILAGGNSIRMNGNKALLPVSGIRLIEKITLSIEPYFDEVIISTNSEETFNFLPYKIVKDEKKNLGPLMGILSSLRIAKNDINFVVACDIPDINLQFIDQMIPFAFQYDIVVPVSQERHYEPLFAFYSKKVITEIEKLLHSGIKKINKLFPRSRTTYFPMKNNDWYHNLNTRKDYHRYLREKNNKKRRDKLRT